MTKNYGSKGLLALAVLLSSTGAFAQTGVKNKVADEKGNVTFAEFDAKAKPQLSNAPAALRSLLNMKAEDELRKAKAEVDQLGFTHERHQQYYKGIKVEHGAYIVHAKAGAVESVNGDFKKIGDLEVTASLSEKEALSSAIKHVRATSYMWQDPAEEAELKRTTSNSKATYFPKGELVVVENAVAGDGSFSVAYKFDIYAQAPISRAYIYVDARTGEVVFTDAIIKHINATGSAATRYSGTRTITTDSYNGSFRLRENVGGSTSTRRIETYNMKKGTSYAAAVDFTDLDNNWIEYNNTNKDNAALDAHWGAEMTHDYFKLVLGRNSYDNAGAIIKSYVHYSTNYDNAYWDGSRMTYGDGSGTGGFDALTSLDVAAHEIGHAVCSSTSNLTYSYESGALNEGFSDIWGACVEYYAAPEKKPWLIGEDIERRSGHVSLRSMENPNVEGQPDTYKGTHWYTGTGDNGGVHYNSGVLNHWFYILSVGKSGSNDLGNSFSVTGLGIDKAAKIAYRTESVYLTSSSNYAAARTGAIQSAKDLYGAGSAEEIAVTNAWYAVGVGAAYGSTTPPVSSYCASKGNSQADEWIDLVQLGSINRTSSKDAGYYNGTALSTSLVGGSTYTVYFSAAFTSTAYTEYWKIWIDFNGNNSFDDAGELILSTSSSSAATLSKAFTVPTTAKNGARRMRVSMKYGSAQTSCETFSYGEVEDYTVNISGATAIAGQNDNATVNAEASARTESLKLGIYPNPATDVLNIALPELTEGATVKISSISGAEVYSATVNGRSHEVNVAAFNAGIYLITVKDKNGVANHKFVKQ